MLGSQGCRAQLRAGEGSASQGARQRPRALLNGSHPLQLFQNASVHLTHTHRHAHACTHTHTRAQPRACTHVHTHALSTHLHAHRSDSSPELVAVLTYLLAALQFSGKNECISLRLCIYYEQKASLKHGTVLLRPPCPVPGGLSVFVVWA